MDQFDPKNLRLALADRPTKAKARKSKGAAWYLGARIPGPWLEVACKLPGKATVVAVAIWHQATLDKRHTVALTRKTRRRFSLSTRTFTRALKQLEAAGLISVRRPPGCHPQITILELVDIADNR